MSSQRDESNTFDALGYLWLDLARELDKLQEPGIMPWETDDMAVNRVWLKICQPSQIPFLELHLSEGLNPTAELVTQEAIKLALMKFNNSEIGTSTEVSD